MKPKTMIRHGLVGLAALLSTVACSPSVEKRVEDVAKQGTPVEDVAEQGAYTIWKPQKGSSGPEYKMDQSDPSLTMRIDESGEVISVNTCFNDMYTGERVRTDDFEGPYESRLVRH